MSAFVQDVSQGGFRFRGREFIPRQASFLLELHLPGSKPVRSLARAAWVKAMPENDGYEVGGIFVEPPREARTVLARHCASVPGRIIPYRTAPLGSGGFP